MAAQSKRQRTSTSEMDKVHVTVRRELEWALTNKGPGQSTYREVFEKFGVDRFGVGLASFMRWARKIRVENEQVGPILRMASISKIFGERFREELIELVARGVEEGIRRAQDGKGKKKTSGGKRGA